MPRVRVDGDFAGLQAFIGKLEGVGHNGMGVVSRQLQETSIDLVREGIDRGVDPYGKKYASLALRSGNPLEDTGALKIFYAGECSARGFGIYSPKAYAIYHQQGTGVYGPIGRPITPVVAKALRIPIRGGNPLYRSSVKGAPQRKMYPDAGDLPPSWSGPFEETTHDVMSELLK